MTQWRSNIHGGCQIRNRIPWIWAEQGRGDEKSGGNEHGEAVRPGLGHTQTPGSDQTPCAAWLEEADSFPLRDFF